MAPRTSRRRLLVALCVAAVLITAACGDDDPDDSPSVPTTTQPKTTTTTTEPATTEPRATETSETEPAENSDEEQLRQLTEDWSEALRQILADGEDAEGARTYLTGPYLSYFLDEAQRRRDEGLVIRRDATGRGSNTIESVVVEGESATILQCTIDADLLVRESDGKTIDDSVVATRFQTVAQLTPEGWRLASRTTVGEWEGKTICP